MKLLITFLGDVARTATSRPWIQFITVLGGLGAFLTSISLTHQLLAHAMAILERALFNQAA